MCSKASILILNHARYLTLCVALIAAYEKLGRLHRDISLGNIILCRPEKGERRVGVLIDWEFSVRVGKNGKARDRCRSVSFVEFLELANSSSQLSRAPGPLCLQTSLQETMDTDICIRTTWSRSFTLPCIALFAGSLMGRNGI